MNLSKSTQNLLTALTIWTLMSCGSDVEFSGKNATREEPKVEPPPEPEPVPAQQVEDAVPKTIPPPEPPPPLVIPKPSPPAPPPTKTDVYSVSFQNRKVDMIWVIDNSASMSEEAAQVSQNFARFLTGLGKLTDLKLALISQSTGNTGVLLGADAAAKGHVQVDIPVGSTNALAVTAAASCALGQTKFLGNDPLEPDSRVQICGRPFDLTDNTQDIEDVASAVAVRGRIAAGLRPEATRIYVIVTDDNARGVNETNFVEMVTPPNEKRRPYVFAFRGIASANNCSVANRGISYESLAQKTMAEVYDICQPDWSAQFKKLTDSVDKIAAQTFELPSDNLAILSVKVDGVVLKPDQYKVEQKKLTVQDGILTATSKQIEVTYEPKSPM